MKLFNVLLRKELITQLFGEGRGQKKDIVGKIVSVIISALFLALFVYLFVAFQSKFTALNLSNEILILFIALAILAQIIFSVPRTGNVLYGGDDAKVILPLPISNLTMLTAKLSALWIKEVVNSCFFLLPVMVAFGIMSKSSFVFYIFVVIAIALTSLFIVSVSAIIAPFFIKVKKFFLSKPLIILVTSLVFLGVLFFAYSKLLSVVSDMLLGNRLKFIFNKNVAEALREISGFMFYSIQIGDFLIGDALGILIVIPVTAVTAVGAYYVSSHFYLSYLKANNTRPSKQGKEQQNVIRSTGKTLIFKELVEILRNPTYMFSYVSVMFTLPALCYLTIGVLNELIKKLLGGDFVVPFAILILIMFSCVCNTFAGDVISREENRIMIVKTIPVNYKMQVACKVGIALAVAFVSDLISVIILLSTGTLDVFQSIMIFFITLAATSASIMHLVSRDINNPVVSASSGENGNVSFAVVRAMIFSVILGAVCFILHAGAIFGTMLDGMINIPFMESIASFANIIGDLTGIMIISLVVCLIDAGYAVLKLMRKLEERMRRIKI